MVGDRFDLSAKVVTAKVEALAFKFDAKTVRNLRLTRRPTATRLKIAPQRTSGLGMQRRPPRKRKSRRLRKRPTRTPQKLRHHLSPSSNPVDDVRNKIEEDMCKIEGSQ